MTITDKGLGLQTVEIKADRVSEIDTIEIVSDNSPVNVRQSDTDTILISIMNNDRTDSEIDFKVDGGKLTVNIEGPSTIFDLSLNPDRVKRETLNVLIPSAMELSQMKIETDDSDYVTVNQVTADLLDITTHDGSIRLIGAGGTVDARTEEGEIEVTSSATKIEPTEAVNGVTEIVNDKLGNSYQGTIGANNGNSGSIKLSSESGDITLTNLPESDA